MTRRGCNTFLRHFDSYRFEFVTDFVTVHRNPLIGLRSMWIKYPPRNGKSFASLSLSIVDNNRDRPQHATPLATGATTHGAKGASYVTHMTLAEFVTTQYGDELPEVIEGAAQLAEWMNGKEAALGMTATFRSCGVRVYHVALLDYRMHMLACGV